MNQFDFKNFLKKEERRNQNSKVKNKIEYKKINLGRLNFDLIAYKIRLSNQNIDDIKSKIIIKHNFLNFDCFSVKITNIKTEYKLNYIEYLKEPYAFYTLFIVIINKVVEVSINYIFEGKIYNFFIFYEIYVQDFFKFMNRVLSEIEIFESYLYDKDCIIKNAIINSIEINVLRKKPNKISIKYI